MRVFFRCVAEAVLENGLKGLAEMVPGGKFAYDVAESVWKKWKEKRQEQQLHDDVVKMAAAKLDESRAAAERVAREVFAGVPVGVSTAPPTPEEIIDLELYLTAIPDAVRQSLKRPDDPTGTTVPAEFALRSAEDVLKLLPPRPPRFRPGAELPGKPGWVLERLLGVGGFGEVWYAKHTLMGSLAGAVKFCFGQSARDLIHEGDLIDRVMRAGTHPNIVPLKDAHLDGTAPWLMFEYVGGGNLTDWIHQLAGRPPEKKLAQVMAALRQLCEAVAYFHSLPMPIVHRDLKPSNILLDRTTKKLRITDFGIGSVTARETNRQESRGGGTRGGKLLSYLRGSHTPLYSSPQQRSGVDPDPRDDVHALGVIAYQMLTGKLDSAPGPRASSTLNKAGVQSDLAELILNCVSEEVNDRPANGKDLYLYLSAKSNTGDQPTPTLVEPPEAKISHHAKPVELTETRSPTPLPMLETGEEVRLSADYDEYQRARLRTGTARSYLETQAPTRFAAWLVAAQAGNSIGMLLVGEAYDFGLGTQHNNAEAVRWYRDAADRGNTCAMFNLGHAFQFGWGVQKSREEAIRWYRQAAELGDQQAKAALRQFGILESR